MDAYSQMSYGDSQESFESPSPSPSPTHVALHRINTVSMIHEEKCFCCGSSSKPESRLIKCSFCPMSYHYECLPAGTVITTPRWGCPSHKCVVCAAPSSKSKGRMFRCVFCPTAFCLAHVSQTCKKIDENPYENSGYNCSTFKFIVCDHCDSRNDEYFQKRKLAFLSGSNRDDNETRPLKRSRTDSYSSAGSAEERAMSYASSPNGSPVIGRARQKPDDELVQIFKEVIGSKFRLQKQLADEIGISQPILSQFLNSATRNNGWRLLEEKLRSWWGIKKQEFEIYEEQKKLARLSNDTVKGQIKAERRNRAVRSAYHYVENGTRGSIDSQSSNEFTETHGSGDSYNSGESDYSPRNSLTSKEEAVQTVAKMQYAGYTAEPTSAPQYAYVYSYPTHVPENYSFPQLQKNFMTSVPLNQHAEAQQTHQVALQNYAPSYEQHNNAAVVSHNAHNTHNTHANQQQSHAQTQPYVMLDYNNYWSTDVFPQHYH